ncbi:disulfide isomerase DsbC N-terminal domain-containing protein [Sulfurivermis fontis]|uniref:disulfide isomerase DsbC N-terminal domain-containing protein n=1 Tax=Sulfurivermis fontis TaxID=1972068 RepID=UPI000FD8C60D|nr:disulfide isomerase DsbC N-terminal domain-containing protein [Sulfurivermis fontis]
MAPKMNLRASALAGLLLVSAHAAAGDQANDSDGEVWRKALPGTKLDEIRPEPRFPGVYEIVMGDKVVYGDATGRYLLFGHIYDVKTNEDVTQQRLDAVNASARIPWDTLPLQLAVRETLAPAGAPKLAILFSTSCAWCKKLYGDVKSARDKDRNITRQGLEFQADVRFMILAPEEPAPNPGYLASADYVQHQLADHILCGGSPELNLQTAMMEDGFLEKFRTDLVSLKHVPGGLIRKVRPGTSQRTSIPKESECDSAQALAAVRNFAKAHGLASTPTLISGDGRVHRGYLPPEKLLAWLSAGTGGPATKTAGREKQP